MRWEEQRRTMQEESQRQAQLAQYNDELARKRMEHDNELARQRNAEMVALQEQAAARKEAERLRIEQQIQAERRAADKYAVSGGGGGERRGGGEIGRCVWGGGADAGKYGVRSGEGCGCASKGLNRASFRSRWSARIVLTLPAVPPPLPSFLLRAPSFLLRAPSSFSAPLPPIPKCICPLALLLTLPLLRLIPSSPCCHCFSTTAPPHRASCRSRWSGKRRWRRRRGASRRTGRMRTSTDAPHC